MQKLVRHCLVAVFHIFLMLVELTAAQNQCSGNSSKLLVRLNNGRQVSTREGRVEVSMDSGATWRAICSTQWSLREGNVVCKQLNLGYASMVAQSNEFGSSPCATINVSCRGNEKDLSKCSRKSTNPRVCANNAQNKNPTILRCKQKSPDLVLDVNEIVRTISLDVRKLSSLKCAMEEKCLAADARNQQPSSSRLLLRFATKTENIGNDDFRPYVSSEQWQYHQCHRHFHSMEYFASFDIYSLTYEKMAEGHKASFCLLDSVCKPGITPVHRCGNNTQGISPGCADIYSSRLDCQWIDVTRLPRFIYYLIRMVVNPEYKIGEQSFENNAVECILYYTGERESTKVINCKQAPLWLGNRNL